MSALDWINAGLKMLVLSIVGWVVVKCIVRDARHRAWAVLLVIGTMLLTPWIDVGESAAVSSLVEVPEWKITISPAMNLPSGSNEEIVALPQESRWTWPQWSEMLLWAWMAGAGVMGLKLIITTVRGMCWMRGLSPINPAEGRLSDPRLRVANGATSPCVAGFWRPVIVVPDSALHDWTPERWRWMLAHETEHLRGGDTRVVWLLKAVNAMLWWNPFVYGLVAEWEQAREEICDHAAAGTEDEAAGYSEFLLSVAEVNNGPGLAMAASRPTRRLRARLISLLTHRKIRRWPHWGFVAGMILVGVTTAVVVSCMGLKEGAESPVPVDEGPMFTRVYKVAPDFMAGGALAWPDDPFATNASPKPRVHASAKQILEKNGVNFSEGASAVYVAATIQVVVKNTKRELEKIEAIFQRQIAKHYFANKQIHVSSKWVEMPDETSVVADGSILTDAQFVGVILELSRIKAMDMLIAPSVTTKFGTRATIEVAKEYVRDGKLDFVGHRLELELHPVLDQLLVSTRADMGIAYADGKRLSFGQFKPEDDVTIKHLVRRESLAIMDGQTFCLEMGQPAPGRKVVLFVTARLIAPITQSAPMKRPMKPKAEGDK